MWHEVAEKDSRVSLWYKQEGKVVRKREKYLGIDLEEKRRRT